MGRRCCAVVVGGVMALVALLGCGRPSANESTTDARQTITVFAAASLKASFSKLGQAFENDHPGVAVRFSFGGSQDLATQLIEGASADVFASANPQQIQLVVDAGLVSDEPVTFATNQLAIAVPPGNPGGVTSWSDLARSDLKVVVCADSVPCGAATAKVEKATGVPLHPVSEEQAVTDVLAKVQAGEADAGIVYKTDVRSATDFVEGVSFPEAADAVNGYSLAVLSDAPEHELATQFQELVLSEQGQRALAAVGFGPAP